MLVPGSLVRMNARDRLDTLLDERIVVLDGSWGVLLQGHGLSEEEFRGERFADHDRDVKGDPDLLNLTQPEIVAEIHDAYLAAGADVTTTNTFTATSIGQADYHLQDAVYDMNVAGARLAREAADRAGGLFVAGSVGPLNVTLSLRRTSRTRRSGRSRSRGLQGVRGADARPFATAASTCC